MRPLIYLVLFAGLIVQAAFAGEAEIRTAMEQRFPYQKILSVKKTPYLGLYEVDFEDRLIYTDEKMTYIFSGNIIDMHTMKNLTSAREHELYAVKFTALPLDLAIKRIVGKGRRKMAVFTDPKCGYCKKLEKEMVDLKNVTIYIFPIAILPGAKEQTAAIWCSSDRLKAWEDHMLRGVDPKAGKNCDTSGLTRISAYAKKLRINVTPSLIFEDGMINPGWMTYAQLDSQLSSASDY